MKMSCNVRSTILQLKLLMSMTNKRLKYQKHSSLSWSREFENYLKNHKSRMINAPLYYVIRNDTDLKGDATSTMERIHAVQLSGQKYMKDSQRVYQLLKSLLVDTDGWNLIRQDKKDDDRVALQSLVVIMIAVQPSR
jgi:hypothetical protein